MWYTSAVVFGINPYGVLFVTHLTYLGSFVIRAVCLLCLASLSLITPLSFLRLRPLLQALKALSYVSLALYEESESSPSILRA